MMMMKVKMMMAEGESHRQPPLLLSCHLHHWQPPPGPALITATSVFLFFPLSPLVSSLCAEQIVHATAPLLCLSSLPPLTPPCISSQLEAVSAPLFYGFYLHVFVHSMCVLRTSARD